MRGRPRNQLYDGEDYIVSPLPPDKVKAVTISIGTHEDLLHRALSHDRSAGTTLPMYGDEDRE